MIVFYQLAFGERALTTGNTNSPGKKDAQQDHNIRNPQGMKLKNSKGPWILSFPEASTKILQSLPFGKELLFLDFR